MTERDRNGLEILGRAECLQLLADNQVGRLAITSEALPVILPVNYRLVGEDILFRTDVGSKLDAATRGTVVAFEIDDHDPDEHRGWSVLVTGTARTLDADETGSLGQAAPIAHWAPGAGGRVVAVSTELVTGRRLGADRTTSAAHADL